VRAPFSSPISRPSLASPLSHLGFCATHVGSHHPVAWDFSSYLKGVVVGAWSPLQGGVAFPQRRACRRTAEGGKARAQLLIRPVTALWGCEKWPFLVAWRKQDFRWGEGFWSSKGSWSSNCRRREAKLPRPG